MTGLQLADDATRADLATYATRARRANPDGAMRLQVVGTTLAAWVGMLTGTGLLGEGTTLGLRTPSLRSGPPVDVTVPLAAICDRMARASSGLWLDIPPQQVTAPWAALTPPRGGWQPLGTVPIRMLQEAAEQGIEEIARGAPDGSGSAAVEGLRRRVWSRSLASAAGADLPAGMAFTLHVLGFGTGESAQVHRAGAWRRLSTPAGYVLAR